MEGPKNPVPEGETHFYKTKKQEAEIMASTSETGHDIDITNSKTVIGIAEGMGAEYQPPVAELEIAVLTPQVTAAAVSQAAVNAAKGPWETATNRRENIFTGLPQLSTRIWGNVQILRIPTNTKDLVETEHKKLQGKWGMQEEVEVETEDTPRERSASQMGYVSRAKNLAALIEKLKLIPEYAPKDTELKIATLEVLVGEMQTLNEDVPKLTFTLNAARDARNKLYYTDVTGLIPTMKDVKGYLLNLAPRGKHPAYVTMHRLQFTTAPLPPNKAADKRKRDAASKKKKEAAKKAPANGDKSQPET